MDDRYLFHIRERCSWPRITRLRHICLHTALSTLPSSTSTLLSSSFTLPLRVRLQPFERTLLSNTFAQLRAESKPIGTTSDSLAERAAAIIFFRWSWADNVLRLALTELDPEWVTECHGGDFHAALDVFRSTLRTRIRGRNDLYDRRYYRTEQLMRDNPRLGERNGIRVEEITVVPHEEDIGIWKELGRLVISDIERLKGLPGFKTEVLELLKLGDHNVVRDCVERMIEETPEFPPTGLFEGIGDGIDDSGNVGGKDEGNDEIAVDAEAEDAKERRDKERTEDWAKITATKIMEAEDLWDVWSFCRMLVVSKKNEPHSLEIDQLIASEEVTEYWKLEVPDDKCGREIIAKQPLSDMLSHRPSQIASLFFKEDSQEFLELEFRRRAHESAIIDPARFFLFYPWETLEEIDPKSFVDLESGLGLDPKTLDNTLCSVSADSVNHTLYLTDDLFPSHVDSDYRYPGLKIGNRVVFRRQKLEETGIVKQFRYFLELWLENRSGFWAAFDFFDLKHRHRNTLSTQHSTIREILGKHYNPSYSDYLVLIDSCEIDLANLEFIGQGSFGAVYKASWARKPIKMYDHTEEGRGTVALKVAMVAKSFDDQAKFFVELATVYSALAGDSSGCVPFYGFCKVSLNKTGHIIDLNSTKESPSTTKQTFALVFDFAEQGDILDFLEKRLKPGEPEENWLVICGALSGLAHGLMTIHKKGIIHRDIHPKNVLVTSLRQAGKDEIEFDCLLSDLGEGKDITTTVRNMALQPLACSASIGTYSPAYADFLSPEIANQPRDSSTADDIFSWALLAVKIISNGKIFPLLCDNDGKILYLAGLMRVLERCLDPNPSGRFDAASLVVVMDEVMDGPSGIAATAYGRETEWYDGSYELPQVRKRLETDSELNLTSGWLKLSSRKRKANSEL
ncbi:kinase-like protein [Lojkania enalia]|uniref:Kinase-like protein n=1 Tax=Lojkania enalia TaxID=147567 RepID=A0A9P4K3X2_9PLEO|nr:kinase-like protein [Didymosphaeria enalia]